MRFDLLILLLAVFVSCKKKEDFHNVKLIGHAASGLSFQNSIFHDNSYEAIEMYTEMSGSNGVEVDVQLSASGNLWLFHNEELSAETNASGCIGSKSDEELDGVSYKSIHKEKLLRLKDIPFAKLKGKTLMLDIRHVNACKNELVAVSQFVEAIGSIAAFKDGSIEVIILLNNMDWIVSFQSLSFPVIYYGAGFSYSEGIVNQYGFDGMIIKNSEISKEQVAKLKSQGKKVIIFEVRSPKGIRTALKKQPDYLVTDDLRATIIEKY